MSRFTARGIVALVFSIITGLLGLAVIAWYGFAEPSAYDDKAIAEAQAVLAESKAAAPAGSSAAPAAAGAESGTAEAGTGSGAARA